MCCKGAQIQLELKKSKQRKCDKSMDEIGLKLKSLRKAKHLSQQEVADNFGWSRTTVSNFEIGRRRPSLDVLQALAAYYGVGLEYFGVATTSKDELLELLARAKKVFSDSDIPQERKEAVYRELMRLYLELGGDRK